MASFVEQATLKVNDQSSAAINKINAALKEMFATAKSLKSITVNIKINDKGIQSAITNMRSLRREMDRMGGHGGATKLNVTVNTASLAAAKAQIAALRTQAQKPIAVAATAGRGGGGGRPPGAVPTGLGMGAGRFASGAVSGAGLGALLGGSYAATAGLYAVGAAGHAAGQALKSIASNAITRDRTALQSSVAASEAQRKIFAEAGDRPAGAGPVSLTKDERDRFRTSLLGDVQGTETEKAKSAVAIVDYMEKTFLPRAFAQSPDKSREEVLEGQRKIIQAMNLASTDLAKAGGGFTQDGLRVINGIQKAMAADPDLTPHVIKTALANAKTAGLSLSEDAIAQLLFNVGARGQRAANEQFRAIKAASGTADVKVLNNSLKDMNLLLDTKVNKKGNVVAGSGTPIDQNLLNTDPAIWFNKHFKPIMDKAIGANATTAEQIAFINKKFAGMSSAGLQGITDLITGFKQSQAQLDQANLAQKQNVDLTKSLAGRLSEFKTAWTDAAAAFGEKVSKDLNLPALIAPISEFMRQHPLISGAVAVGAPVATAGAILAGPAIALTGSAFALKGSAAALTAAAGRLGLAGAAGAVPGAAGAAAGAAGAGGAAAASRWAKVARVGGRFAGAAGVAVLAYDILSLIGEHLADKVEPVPVPKNAEELAFAQADLYGATQRLKEAQDGLAKATKPEEMVAFTAEIDKMQARIAYTYKAIEEGAKALGIEPPDLDPIAKAAVALGNLKVAAMTASEAINAQNAEIVKQLGYLPKPAPFPKPPEPPKTKAEKQLDKERQEYLDRVARTPMPPKPKVPPPKREDRTEYPPGIVTDVTPVPVKVAEPPPPTPALQKALDDLSKTTTDALKPSWEKPPTVPGGPYPGGVPAQVGPPITEVPKIDPAPISSAVSEGIKQGAPALSPAMSEALSTLSSTFKESISGAAQPITDAGTNLSGSLQTGASSISSAGQSLAGAGETAAAAIKGGAADAGSAYGNAAAAIIKSAVANVTISVQHSGSPTGNADKGTNTGN